MNKFRDFLGIVCVLAMMATAKGQTVYLFTGAKTNITLNPGNYYITAYGAQGGGPGRGTSAGGLGAEMEGEFNFTTMTTLTLLVGGTGATGGGNISGGGGGGSFVVAGSKPLVVAGGGGGAGYYGGGAGSTGTGGGSGGASFGGSGGAAGSGGGGGDNSNYGGGGGGGFLDDGSGGGYTSGGRSFFNGDGAGYDGGTGNGGGGGGGGYSGGGGGGWNGGGGGGGSFIDTSAIAILSEISGIASPDGGLNGEIIITALPIPPSIIIQPTSATNNIGGTVTFIVGVTNAYPVTYQWTKDGITLPYGTNATLTFINVQPVNVGNYAVTITDIYSNSITSSNAMLTLNGVNSDLWQGLVGYYLFNGNANDASLNGNNGTNYGVTFTTDRFGNPNSAGSFAGSQQEYIALPFLTNLMGSFFATYSFWLNMDTNTAGGCVVGGWGDNYGANNSNLGFYTDIVDGGLIGAYNNSGVGANQSINPVPNGWHQIIVVLSGTNSAISDRLKFYIDGNPVQGNYGTVNSVVGNAFNYFIGRRNFDFGTYGGYYTGIIDDVRIYNSALTGNDVAALFALEAPTNPPSVTTNPIDFFATANQSASFNVTATGSGILNYQWQFNGTNLLSGTNSTLSIATAKQANIGQYTVVITNAYGSITSSVANLFMYPYLNQPFKGVDTYWGQTNTLSVGAWGSGNLAYQWYFNGVPLNGATNLSLPLGAIQFANAGQYSVVVSSALGSVTNAPYSVVVNPANVSLGLFAGVIIQGTVGYNYNVQTSTNLGDTNSWVTLTNITLTAPIQIWNDNSTDVHDPNSTPKFYRVEPGQ